MRQTNRSSRIGFLTAIGGLALVLAACSSSGASTAPSAAAPSAAPSAAAAGGGGEVYTVDAANGAVGAYLTGEDGKTLYIFTPDSNNASTCVDACAGKWPPFVLEDDETLKAGTGVTAALATFARADGAKQVSINGHPVYYYAADTKAGDTTGQGAGGKWFVIGPDGTVPSAAPSAASRY